MIFKNQMSKFTSFSFIKDDEGKEIFYPWGGFGTGYVISSPEDEQAVRRMRERENFLSWGIVILTILIWNAQFWFVPIILSIVYCMVDTYKTVKNLPKTPQRLKFSESLHHRAENFPPTILWLGAFMVGLPFLASVMLLFIAPFAAVEVVGLVFFGACLGLIAGMIRFK